MNDNWFSIFLASFGLGIFLRSLIFIDFYVSCFVLFISVVIFLITFFLDTRTEKKVIILCTLSLITFSLGVLRFSISDHKPVSIARAGVQAIIKVIVIDEPDIREDHSNLIVEIEPQNGNDGQKFIGRILISTDRYTPYEYGDELLLTGKIKLPENFSASSRGSALIDSRAEAFDYVSYLAKDGIYYQMFRPQMEKIASGKGNKIKEILFNLKHSFLGNINQHIAEPESSLLAGLVVGAKQSLGKKLLADFRLVGVIPIVVLSGYHLTIVAQAMMRLFTFLPRLLSFSMGGLGIILFASMTGGSATIVRASIMSLLVLLAQGVHRDYNMTRALFLAGFFMVMQNPHILVFDPSFQLSFLATIALIYLAPHVKKYFTFVPERFGLRELAVSTIATQLFVLPFLLYSMGTLSLVALPVNLILLPLIPLTMFFGFTVGTLSFISSLLTLPFAFIAHIFLWYELWIVELFASFPFASVSISYFPFWLMTLLYASYTGFFLWRGLPVSESITKEL
jgi:competence protein ComEC